MSNKDKKTSIDPNEIHKFEAMADDWWRPDGIHKPLHVFVPIRIKYIKETLIKELHLQSDSLSPFKNLKIADVGCGGGLLSEPLARLGAQVTGIDGGQKNIEVARMHAQEQDLSITYLCSTIEEVVQQQSATFDVIIASEIIEHVSDSQFFVDACSKALKPGGLLIISTLNRTLKSYFLAIIGAEYILRMVPKGTHQWERFLKPSELHKTLINHNCKIIDLKGLTYHPIEKSWKFSNELNVNYILTAQRLS
ncbi:bifunctional 2-polyprenyl-6-hydroxyphenol methylase/3-demethylubiquinol 3-O-methyltransferase UbiG [Candidatus Nucleicultrix amoebiphila]|jgi:2-polyprenyl-6-hydroxyphenyl methylase/3-demethylubiquinone-9 3-methyltransferase|uniref:Ubiquinone biosynthesis O-methyltransferase n=1 Tax=Candidatus Nucleicultrix amoebiphila FS5 TaxID=1414854 RepID=A0A1W6N674_9PROT|nr:bifunctional 2-polyprenyl-6-hydroxyphenol methylase/3-demethylubiquinol 3-O-methyltransferase UbiG [Candidatus Nucleicultrix amoebiphila]ARN85282.1 3-demethylubiquinone-9 3-methyltransferase [Candidatus Nucleicultrix amoebiphila FS5]